LEQQWHPYPFSLRRHHEVLDRLPGDLAAPASTEEEELAKASKPKGKSLAALLGGHAYFTVHCADAQERRRRGCLWWGRARAGGAGSTRERILLIGSVRPGGGIHRPKRSREGEGIAERVQEDGEKGERLWRWIRDAGRRHRRLLYSEREDAPGSAVYFC
jgi:hypothetical protein